MLNSQYQLDIRTSDKIKKTHGQIQMNAGIVRNYPGTNHYENYRWNTTEQPFWMNLLITNQETAYNKALVDNDPIVRWTSDSPEYTLWK